MFADVLSAGADVLRGFADVFAEVLKTTNGVRTPFADVCRCFFPKKKSWERVCFFFRKRVGDAKKGKIFYAYTFKAKPRHSRQKPPKTLI